MAHTNSNIISRIKNNFIKIFRNPRIVGRLLYRRHLGLIFSYDLRDHTIESKPLETQSVIIDNYEFELTTDAKIISDFYLANGRGSFSMEEIKIRLEAGHQCWLVLHNGTIAGGLWLLLGEFEIKPLHGRVLSNSKTIKFQERVGYRADVLIDPAYRGKGIYKSFNKYLLDHYRNLDTLDKIILITGANNYPVVKTNLDMGANLIGIVEVLNILGVVKRKVIYFDLSQKAWT